MGTQRWKLISLLLVLLAAGYYLWPNYQYYYALTPEERAEKPPSEVVRELRSKVLHLGLDLLGGMHVVLEADLPEGADQADDSIDRVVEILRNRVDAFGVAEPVIQKQGSDRIVVDLAGVQDEESVRKLIGETARLEFRMCKNSTEAGQILDRVDRYLAAVAGDSAGAEESTVYIGECRSGNRRQQYG